MRAIPSTGYRRKHQPMQCSLSLESLEIRCVLSGSSCGPIDYPDSRWVQLHDDESSLQFASLTVGRTTGSTGTTSLDDDMSITVRDYELTVGQVKEYLHGFADSVGTNLFPEFNDLRFAEWGIGSSPTFGRFEDFIEADQLARSACEPLRFGSNVRFEQPGTPGEPFFTGSSLDLPVNQEGTLITEGDIAELVLSYEISPDATTLTVNTHIRVVEFQINDDGTLTDAFGGVWTPGGDYEIVDPSATDLLLGDINDDQVVDFADFLILSGNFGTSVPEGTVGDLDCSGTVDFADFLLLSANFGRSSA